MSQTDTTPEQLAKAREYQRLYRLNNSERVRANQRTSYRRNFEADPDKLRGRNKKWRGDNPEKMRASRDKWTANNKEYARERSIINAAKFRAEHPELAKARIQAWRAKNKDKIREYAAKWRATHRVELSLHEGKRRAKTGDKIDRTQILNWESRICGICGLLIEGRFHIDHITPISKGGLHAVSNLQLAHPFCNLSKKDKIIT